MARATDALNALAGRAIEGDGLNIAQRAALRGNPPTINDLIRVAVEGERKRKAEEQRRAIWVMEWAAELAPHAVRAGLDPNQPLTAAMLVRLAEWQYAAHNPPR